MTESAVTTTDAGTEEFQHLTEPFRRELLAHCYRLLGSVHDAEDLVQETYVRAWRAYDGFEGRSSLRNWLYRIATNVCLRALEQRARRALPSGLGPPSDDPGQAIWRVTGPGAMPLTETAWLQPLPDSLVDSPQTDPADIAVAREGTRLAFVAALQHLPARQRAALILRDVLRWPVGEVAELLDTSTTAVNSILQRARAQMAAIEPAQDTLAEPAEPERRTLLDRYVAAFENADIAGLAKLLHDDVVIEMPPSPMWFEGVESCRRFLAGRFGAPGDFRLVPTSANGQPAFAKYFRDDDGIYRAHSVHVLTITTTGIARVTVFIDDGLFPTFGLPETTA